MSISLFLIYPGTDQALHLNEALVTWACRGEFGIQIQQVQQSEVHQVAKLLATSGHIG